MASVRPVRSSRSGPGIRNDLFVPGRKVVPSAVPPSFGDAALRDRRAPSLARRPIGAARYRWRSAPEPSDVHGAWAPVRVRSGGSRVHSLPSSLRFPPATGSLCRRAKGTRPVHCPFFAMWPGVWAGDPEASSRTARAGGQRLEAAARDDRQRRVAGKRRIGSGPLTEHEPRPAPALDRARVDARVAESRGDAALSRVAHQRQPGSASSSAA
jgi:hypothetical protein